MERGLWKVKDIYGLMKSVDLYKAIKLGGFTNAQLTISDVDYALPKASWLTGTFYDFYKNWRWEHNLNEWSNKNDCVAGFEKVVTPIGPKVISDLKDGDVVLTTSNATTRCHCQTQNSSSSAYIRRAQGKDRFILSKTEAYTGDPETHEHRPNGTSVFSRNEAENQ